MSGGKISYRDAMESLTAMFQGIDEEVIKMVLEANEGRLDPTINTLMSMAAANEQAGPRPVGEINSPAPARAPAPVRPPEPEQDDGLEFPPLPDDFLRPPGWFDMKKNKAQKADDENFARMLQAEFDKAAAAQTLLDPVLYYPPHGRDPAPPAALKPKQEVLRPPPVVQDQEEEEEAAAANKSGIGEAFSNLGAAAVKRMDILREKFKRNRERRDAQRISDGFAGLHDEEDADNKQMIQKLPSDDAESAFRPIEVGNHSPRHVPEDEEEDPFSDKPAALRVGQLPKKIEAMDVQSPSGSESKKEGKKSPSGNDKKKKSKGKEKPKEEGYNPSPLDLFF